MDFDPFFGENDDKRAGYSFNLRRCPIQIRIDAPNDLETNVLQTESYEEPKNNRNSHHGSPSCRPSSKSLTVPFEHYVINAVDDQLQNEKSASHLKKVRHSWNTENEFNYFNEILTKVNSCEDLFDHNGELTEEFQLKEKQLPSCTNDPDSTPVHFPQQLQRFFIVCALIFFIFTMIICLVLFVLIKTADYQKRNCR